MSETTPATAPSRFKPWKLLLNLILGRSSKPTTIPKDGIREALETVVFVVVLVFLLKQFVVEAFVIPTGSMAETLYGDNKSIKCSECGYAFQINSHCEVESDDGGRLRAVAGYCCPNCRFKHAFKPETYVKGNESGDRVLVLKAIYHREKALPGDVVVFKFPEKPQKDYGALNYIKRMWATGGQTLAIWRGDLYVCDTLTYQDGDQFAERDLYHRTVSRPENPNNLWKREYTYYDADKAIKLFHESQVAGFPDAGTGFKLIRKSPTLIEEMKRIVCDNDHQSATLAKTNAPRRWSPATADWTTSDQKMFKHTGQELGWLRYRNLIVEDWNTPGVGGAPASVPRLIDNFLGYNGEVNSPVPDGAEDFRYWVGDLIAECWVNVPTPGAKIVMELSKGPNRFQAVFVDGRISLLRLGVKGEQLANAPSPVAGAGHYKLRFANVDCRLHVWVNGKPVDFGKPVDYAPALPEKFADEDVKQEGWIPANDIDQPVSIGATHDVEVSQLRIWRDTFFINEPYSKSEYDSLKQKHIPARVSTTVATYYVQPGHYLCLGDNSSHSSDSRYWGTVPERLLLGKAVSIFYPLDRIGLIK